MKPFFLLSCLLLFCPLFLKAQSNFKPGFVVTMQGDTLRGYINYREWTSTPASIAFKTDAGSSTETTFDVTNAGYFEITGMEAYKRYEGRITMNPTAINRLLYEPAVQLAQVTVFLKLNYSGELVDLLSYTDAVKTRFFYQEKDGSQPQELYFNRYYASSNSNTIITQKGFVGQFQHLAGKYNVATSRLNSDFETAQYNEQEFEGLMSKLNEIRVSKPAPKDKSRSRSRYFAGIALNSSQVRISGFPGLNNPDRSPASFMPLLSFGFDTFLNKNIQKFFFRVEGALTAASYQVENEVQREYSHSLYSYKIAYQNLSFSPQLIYSLYNKDNFKFHVGLLGQFNLSNYSKNNYGIDRTDHYSNGPDRNEIADHKDFLSVMPFWFAYGFRAGAVMNRQYELYATYIPFAAVTQYTTHSIEFRSVYLGMNYFFNR